jgi:hypothetical protein
MCAFNPNRELIESPNWFCRFGLFVCYATMDTKLKGDIAEQAAVLHALKHGWGMLKPIGDRLPYDLVFDVKGALIKLQVKSSWFNQATGNYVVDNPRTKTNRRSMVREPYTASDFDFALVYLADLDLFYVFPVSVFIGYGSEIHLVEADKRQRKPRSAEYRNAWDLISRYCTNQMNLFPTETPQDLIANRFPSSKRNVEQV